MLGPHTASDSDEAQQPQHQMLPQLLLEVPIQRESLLGRQRVYQCKCGSAVACAEAAVAVRPAVPVYAAAAPGPFRRFACWAGERVVACCPVVPAVHRAGPAQGRPCLSVRNL